MKQDQIGKELLLDKSFALLLHKGFDGVSITDIQQATGLSRGLIYHYYKSKEELFIEATERYFVDMFRIDEAETRDFTIDRMIRFVEIMNRELCRYGQMPDGQQAGIAEYDFLFYQVVRRSPAFAAKYRKVRDDEVMIWTRVVENTRRAGLIREALNPEETARIFISIMDGVWFNESTFHKPEQVVHAITVALQSYYGQLGLR